MAKTVGKISTDLQRKAPDSRDPIEIQRAIHHDYEKHFSECVDNALKTIEGDFYVCVITKKERLMNNVLRNYFLSRSTCPTPDYDQTVYKYHRNSGTVEFLWVLPSKDTCELFKQNALQIAPEERHLLDFILMDSSGELLALSKKLNGEKKESIKLEGK